MNNFYNETHKTNKVLNLILKNQIKIGLKESDTIPKKKPSCLTSSVRLEFLKKREKKTLLSCDLMIILMCHIGYQLYLLYLLYLLCLLCHLYILYLVYLVV